MRFDTPATTNPIDQLKVIGRPTDRIDGPLKTTGTAPYAYERHDVAPNAAYGYVVGAAISKGRITSIDESRSKAAPGVIAIVTYENAGKLGKGSLNAAKLLGGPNVEHYHQAIALVVAETFEQAARCRAIAAGSNTTGGTALSISPRRKIRRTVGLRIATARSATSPARSPRPKCNWTRPTPRPTNRTP